MNKFENFSSNECDQAFLDMEINYFNQEIITSTYIKVGDIELTPYMLKSLDPFISDEEENLLKSYSKVFKRGWLYDSIIDAFLLKILFGHNNYMSISSLLSLSVLQSKPFTKRVSDIIMSKELLFIPFNNNSHWVLIVADLKDHYFEFYDPLKLPVTTSYNLVIRKWCMTLKDILKSHDNWEVKCPEHTLQNDNMNCGVFVCYYAYQKINKLNLNQSFDPLFFRKFIYGVLTN
jgi:Ulp1 family protease